MTKTEINFIVTVGLLFFYLIGAYGYIGWLIRNLLKGRES